MKTKKIIILGLFLLFPLMLLYSQNNKEIIIIYRHSRRVPYNTIFIRIDSLTKRMTVKTSQMNGETGFEYSNTDMTKEISDDFFDTVYRNFLGIDFNSLNSGIGLDGFTVTIIIMGTTPINYYHYEIWTPGYDRTNTNQQELKTLLLRIFKEVGLEKEF